MLRYLSTEVIDRSAGASVCMLAHRRRAYVATQVGLMYPQVGPCIILMIGCCIP